MTQMDTEKIEERTADFDRQDFRFSFVMLVVGFLFVKLILAVPFGAGRFGLGVFVFSLCFVSAVLVRFRHRGIRPDRSVAGWLAALLLLAAFFVLSDNTVLQRPALAVLIPLAAYFVLALGKGRIEPQAGPFLFFDLCTALLILPFRHFGALFAAQKAGVKRVKSGGAVGLGLLGAVLVLPVCLFVGSLLRRADAAFEQVWQWVAASFWVEEGMILILQILLSVPVSLYLFGLILGALRKGEEPPMEPETAAALLDKPKVLPQTFVIGAVTPLLALYLLFFFSQSAYFLSAFGGSLPQDMIYSEYARRGFFELCSVSFINLVFIGVLLFLTKQNSAALTRLYGCLLAACSIALVVISLSKMLLYIGIYGLTPLRVYTSWFMLFILLVFVTVILRLFRPAFNMIRCWACVGLVMLLVLCYAGSDSLIAGYNLSQYRSGSLAQLDVAMMSELGGGAVPTLAGILTDETLPAEYRETAQGILRSRLRAAEYQSDSHEADWRGFTWAGYQARQTLFAYRAWID